MSGLRERRHAETRRAILDAAFCLFDMHHGFAETTMEQIAQAAGVSRSTLYRRYSSKEDIVLEVPRRWLVVWDEAVNALTGTETLEAAVREGCMAVSREIDANRAEVLSAYAARSESPALQSSSAAGSDWLERTAKLVQSKCDLDLEDSMVIAGAYMGAIDTMMVTWARSGGATSVAESTDRLLTRLAPILPG